MKKKNLGSSFDDFLKEEGLFDSVTAIVAKRYFAKIGAKGGKKSRRTLTAAQARMMVKAREALRKAR